MTTTWTPNEAQQALMDELLSNGQAHLFADWDEPGVNDDAKRAFVESIEHANAAYPGGLKGYIENARALLAEAKEGKNPFEGCVPEQPDKVDLTEFDAEYDRYEAIGAGHFDKTAFVMVAGGLGERLGYSGIKIDIPVEVTETRRISHTTHPTCWQWKRG